MWLGHQLLCDAQAPRDLQQIILIRFSDAATMLRSKGPQMMTESGVHISPEDQAIFDAAADQVETCKTRLEALTNGQADPDAKLSLLNALTEDMQPAVIRAMNLFSELFITLVQDRQQAQRRQADTAISGLDRISKQIFFISINASVEAARVGDAGRGFLQISSDIRALSQSAQNATQDLSSLVIGDQG